MTDRTDPERSPGPWLPKPGAPRPCAYCGQPFRPFVPTATYCTTLCRLKAKQARRTAQRQQPPMEDA